MGLEQVAEAHLQSAGQGSQDQERRIGAAILQKADGRLFDLHRRGQVLLSPAAGLP